MPRIPVYTSRASAPGPIPGLGRELAAPGRALTRLGGAIIGFGEDLARRAARQSARSAMRRTASETSREEPQDQSVDVQGSGGQQDAAEPAGEDVRAVLDPAQDDARFAVMRADALQQASLDSEPEQRPARALAYFDAATEALLAESDDPARREIRQVLARAHREVLVQRLEQRRNGELAASLNGKLASALDTYATAVHRDPAMLPAMLKQGTDTIAEAARLAGLDAGQAAAMTTGWIRQAHVALVDGTIARSPKLALASLESGELDAALGKDAALIARLTQQARNAVTVAEAADTQRARTRRQEFDLQLAEHLERIRSTGRGEPELATLAEATLDPEALAAFRDEVALAGAEYAARRSYAFMTAAEIEADIRENGAGRDQQDTDERAAGQAARIAARDAVLAERAADPAAWAMGDETVAQAFAAAEAAADAAASPGSGLAESDQADRAFRHALALRWQVQAGMGEAPRLLSADERDRLAEDLPSLPPVQRLTRIGELRRRYGEWYDGLVEELSSRVAPGTAVLLAHASDPALAGALARGMDKDGVAHRGPREMALPLIDGTLDKSRLEDGQLYHVMTSGRILRVVYDGTADALVPAPSVGPEEHRRAGNEDGNAQTARGASAKDDPGLAHVRPSPAEARRNKQQAMASWLRLARFGKNVPGGWRELPRRPDGSIDRHALEIGQVYHVVGANGVRSAWRWTEKDRAFMPFRGRTIAFSIDGMHELIGVPVRRTTDGRPIYNMEQDRINAINWGIDAVFEIAGNPAADDSSPVWERPSLGNDTVRAHNHLIERISARYGVDSDLVRAIMWTEAARGHKYGLNALGDALGVSASIMPMNIQPERWAALIGGTRKDLEEPGKNIEASVILIRRLAERVIDPTPEKLGTLWNSLAKETVTDLGAYYGRIHREKPWLPVRPVESEAPPGKPGAVEGPPAPEQPPAESAPEGNERKTRK